MKKTIMILMGVAIVLMLTACGGVKNDSPMDAAETFMKSMVEGDSELNAEINHSNPLSFPPQYMIEKANEQGLVDKKLKDITFEEHESDSNIIVVSWENVEGETKDWELVFIKEKEGYFFKELN